MKFAIPLSMLPMDEIKPLGIAADEIGYDFLAVSDHLIHPENFSVPYPYTDDGSVRWEQGTDWPDPINSLSFLPDPQPIILIHRLRTDTLWGLFLFGMLAIYWTGRKLVGMI